MPLLVPPSNLGVFNPSLLTRRVFTQARMEFRVKNPLRLAVYRFSRAIFKKIRHKR